MPRIQMGPGATKTRYTVHNVGDPDTSTNNPLLGLSFAIPFDQIRAEHIEPAATALLRKARARLDGIARESGPRTFDNTLSQLDLATEELETAMTVVSHLESVMSNPELRAAYNQVQPEVSAFYASIPLDAGLWRAISEYAASEEAKSWPPGLLEKINALK